MVVASPRSGRGSWADRLAARVDRSGVASPIPYAGLWLVVMGMVVALQSAYGRVAIQPFHILVNFEHSRAAIVALSVRRFCLNSVFPKTLRTSAGTTIRTTYDPCS